LLFQKLVLDGHVQPSEIPKLTLARLSALLRPDSSKKKEQGITHGEAVQRVREYQRKYLGRKD